MLHLHDLDVQDLQNIPGYKTILRAVLRSQIQQLVEHLSEQTGEETIVLSASLTEGTMCHLGSKRGRKFLTGREEIKSQFLSYVLQSIDSDCEKMENSQDFADDEWLGVGKRPSTEKLVTEKSPERKSSEKQKYTTNVPMETEKPEPKKTTVIVTLKKLPNGLTMDNTSALISTLISLRAESVAADTNAEQYRGTNTKLARFLMSAESLKKVKSLYNPGVASKSDQADGIEGTPKVTRSGRKVSSKFGKCLKSLRPNRVKQTYIDLDEETGAGDEDAICQQLGDLARPMLKEIQLAVSQHDLDECEVQVTLTEETETDAPDVKFYVIENDLNNQDSIISGEAEHKNMDSNENDEKTIAKASVSLVHSKRMSKPQQKKNRKTAKLMSNFESYKIKKKAPVNCDICGVVILGKSNLQMHVKHVHLKLKSFACKICSSSFSTGRDRESHVLSVHTRQCADCKTYVTETEPWPEGTKKTDVRDVLCSCGSIVKVTTTYGRRRSDIKFEGVEEKSNVSKKGMRDTKFACGTCGKLFMSKRTCQQHQQCHSDVRSHICYVCSETYTFRKSLMDHLKKVHGIAAYICEVCGRGFSKTTTLKIHIAKAHASQIQMAALDNQRVQSEAI